MTAPLEILRPLSALTGGRLVTIVLRDGTRLKASTSMVHMFDMSGVIAYDMNTKKTIPRDSIKGWIA